jgi:hypothetical protein
MNKEFKKVSGKSETRYILETASAGGTSSGDVGSVASNLGMIKRRVQELKKTVKVPTKPPRNPVGMGSTPGRGTQKHTRSDRKNEKDSKKIFELDDDNSKIFIKFRLSEMPNEETRIIMFGGPGNKPKDIKRQDSIFSPVNIDYKDTDDSILKIKNVLSELEIGEKSKIFIDIPSYLSDILEDIKDAIETEIIDDNKNIELFRKPNIDNGLKKDDEEDSLHYLMTHPKSQIDIGSKDKKSPDTTTDTDNDVTTQELPKTDGNNLIIPTTIQGNRFIKQLVSDGILNSNDIKLIGNTLYISKNDFNTVKQELKNRNLKDIEIHKFFPVKKFMRENKEQDHEISMASSELKSIMADAKKILAKIKKYKESEGIMAWQQSKITKSADYMNSVNQSLDENTSSILKKKVENEIKEDLRKWFKEKWVRFGPDGKIRGDCARGSSSEGKPKCLPQSKAHSLGKKGRASSASRKRREDPNPERKGSAINVATKKKTS